MLAYSSNIKTRIAHLLIALSASAVLSACGARTEDASSGDTQPTYNANGELISGVDEAASLAAANLDDAVSLRVVSDVNSIVTGGSDVATITAVATDANNNVVPDATVTFQSSSGILRSIVSTTDENGEASAILALPDSFDNQDVVVTVVSDDATDDSEVRVIASGSSLDVTGTDTLITGDDVSMIFRLVAGNGEPIAFQPLSVNSVGGSVLSSTSPVTDEDGQAEVSISAVSASDTVTASALNGTVSASHSFEVVADLLSFTNVDENDELAVLDQSTITVNWVSQGSAVTFQTLRFSTTAGVIDGTGSVDTDISGNASIQISSSSAGPATITVEGTGTGDPKTSIEVEFVATDPGNVDFAASATRVAVNESSTLLATVSDDQGNPVKNSQVTFTSEDLKGGQISPATATTNSEGVATSTFTAGALPTAVDEIGIIATVTAPIDVSDPAVERALDMTVYKRSLNITLGSNNTVKTLEDGIQYAMPFLVKVTNGSGAAIEDASVEISVRPLTFSKGTLARIDSLGRYFDEIPDGEDFSPERWATSRESIYCDAEDRNGNRFLDTSGSLTEDINGNSRLDPQDPVSIASVNGADSTVSNNMLSTDANGSGLFDVAYPASNAWWSYLEITASAEALGVEATQTYRLSPSLPVSEVTAMDVSPSNYYSPYGSVDLSATVVSETSVDGEIFSTLEGCQSEF